MSLAPITVLEGPTGAGMGPKYSFLAERDRRSLIPEDKQEMGRSVTHTLGRKGPPAPATPKGR